MFNMDIIGRLVRDAEVKNETSISFTIAVNFYDSFKKEKDVSFIKCFLDKSQFINMQKYLTKGSQFFCNVTPIKMDVYNNKPSIMAKVNLVAFAGSKPIDTTLHSGDEKNTNSGNPKSGIPGFNIQN